MGRRPQPAGIADQKAAVRSTRSAAAPAAQVVRVVTPPDWLDEAELAIWDDHAPRLIAAKLLTPDDALAFGMFCAELVIWHAMRVAIKTGTYKYVSTSKHGQLERFTPDFVGFLRLKKVILDTMDRFGMNPSARQSIMVARLQHGVTGDLFGVGVPPASGEATRADAPASAPAAPIESPVGMLN
jgi:phage terminase small subunit